MLRLMFNWFLSAVSLLIVTRIVPGFVVTGIGPALLAVIVIGLVNGTLGIFLKLVTLPLSILTLGIFWLVINALMLMAASALVPGFKVQGFWPAFIGSIVLSLVNLVMNWIVRLLTSAPNNTVF